MIVELKYNSSDNNTINKNISSISCVNCILKDPVDIEKPRIILDTFNYSNVNYVYIPEFNRSYFITDITNLTGGRVELALDVDVLESFKSSILSLSAIIEKQQNTGNKYFNDGSFNVLASEFVQSYNFPEGFSDSGEFILITCGG
jgi:hypothetical protein